MPSCYKYYSITPYIIDVDDNILANCIGLWDNRSDTRPKPPKPLKKPSDIHRHHSYSKFDSVGEFVRDWLTAHLPKKRCVKVAMKLISINRPTTASSAAMINCGSPS